MRSIPGAIATTLASSLTALATCWKVTLADETVKAFTDHDNDLEVDSVTYLAASGYTASDVDTAAALNVDNLEVAGFLSSPSITEADLLAGFWDYALVEIFMVNWVSPSDGIIWQRKGRLGEVTCERGVFKAELRGLMQHYTATLVELTSPTCRAKLGDARCTVDMDGFTVTGTLTSVGGDNMTLGDSGRSEPGPTGAAPTAGDSGYFDRGTITFTSGNNEGLSQEVMFYTPGQMILVLPMLNLCQVGDTYSMTAGCDKAFATCGDKFSNKVNFRGEPWLRGMDALVQVGRRTTTTTPPE